MSTENTSLKNRTPAGDKNTTTDDMAIAKSSIYQNPFFIVASSLLAFLVLVVVASNSGGGQYLKSSTHELTKGAGALDTFGMIENGDSLGCTAPEHDTFETGKFVECCNNSGLMYSVWIPCRNNDLCLFCACHCYCWGDRMGHGCEGGCKSHNKWLIEDHKNSPCLRH